tara:strand:+ start:128398 stop:129609 length:1212 start_codon:yes stop_codon:yes gene_type:complete
MQGTQNQTKSGANSIMPFTKDSSNKDETSGLHDLQAMASSAKRRRSQRLSTQMDAQDSLLQSTAALDAVVLPDPSKEQEVSIDPISATATASPAAKTAAATLGTSVANAALPVSEMAESTSSSGKGLYIGLLLAAAVAAGAYFVLGSSAEEPVAAQPSAAEPSAAEPSAAEPSVAVAPDVEEPAPSEEPAVVPALDPDEESADSKDEGADIEAASDPVDVASAKSDDSEKVVKSSKTENSSKNNDAKSEAKPSAEKTKVAAVVKDKKPADKKPAEPKAEKKPDANASLDDVLSSVTGGVDKPIAKEKTDTESSKTSLSRGDIAKAMGKVKGAAKGCYKVEEFSGMVKVKYSVGPDGSVTKAAATGAHASSPTGACVVKAALKAKFPAYSGAAMSSTYPFLLAP